MNDGEFIGTYFNVNPGLIEWLEAVSRLLLDQNTVTYRTISLTNMDIELHIAQHFNHWGLP